MLFVLQSKNSKFKGSTVFLVIYVCRHQDFVTFKLSGQEFLRKLPDNFFQSVLLFQGALLPLPAAKHVKLDESISPKLAKSLRSRSRPPSLQLPMSS